MLLYSHLTNDELFKLVSEIDPPNPLMQELAFRLENQYSDDLAVGIDE